MSEGDDAAKTLSTSYLPKPTPRHPSFSSWKLGDKSLHCCLWEDLLSKRVCSVEPTGSSPSGTRSLSYAQRPLLRASQCGVEETV